jgi:hypothetical protein
MTDHHGATIDDSADIAEHEATYAGFIQATEIGIVYVLSIVLLLVLWGLQGHGFVALIGLILATGAAAVGAVLNLGWRAGLPVFLLLGLAAIVL